ncbi:hypothetical protein ACIRJM_23260 [Streptomyces sp. NPDC102405]|uniref:hypothetical protein n=1 Tax=Streptomyces sp. NPDC102405 TaxID=3366170 RepID=UPI003803A932
MTVDLSRMDTPLPVLTLQLAAIRTTSVSAKCAFALDAWLIQHPEVPVATDADYPAWAAALAARPTYHRTKEAS